MTTLAEEVLGIIAAPTDDGTGLNEIADEFRCGRDVNELLLLLNSSNAELASIGAWILGEVSFELYNSDRILSRLHRLTEHSDPAVRFHAFGALFPALNPDEPGTRTLLERLLRDPNHGVRQAAEAAADRLSLKRR